MNDEIFAARYRRHEDELQALYMELYHGDKAAFEYFVQMMQRMAEDRPAALRLLDQERVVDPRWYKGHELVGMLMYVKAFAGTLNGVREKLVVCNI